MHLSTEDLLDLIHGDTHPEDLDEQLNHMDRCQECADLHAVLVSLQVHRDAALEALRDTVSQLSSVGGRSPELDDAMREFVFGDREDERPVDVQAQTWRERVNGALRMVG